MNIDETKIGGSSWTDVLGLDPWGCQRRAIYRLRQQPPDFPKANQGAMDRGHALEEVVARELAEEMGWKIRRWNGKLPKDAPSWARLHTDRDIVGRITLHGTSVKGPVVYEGKTTGYDMTSVPLGYELQCQWYMYGRNAQWAYIRIKNVVDWSNLDAVFERDPSMIAKMLHAGDRTMRMVEHGPMPARLLSTDRRCRKCEWRSTCHGQYVVPDLPANVEVLELDKDGKLEMESALEEYDRAAMVATKAEKIKADARDKLLRIVGDTPQKLSWEGRRISVVPPSQRLDTQRLRADHPDLYNDYTVVGHANSLRVYR